MVGGVRSSRMNRAELSEQMVHDVGLARGGILKEPRIVVSSNGLVIAKFHTEPEFRALLTQADIIDVDGMPLVLATRIFCKHPLRERVATTDFILDASAAAEASGTRFFFFGAKPGIAAQAAANLRIRYPGIQIVGTRHGYFDAAEEEALCREIVESGADVLWLGLGSPLQEQFAVRNRARLSGLAWVRTCGGLFDFYSERMPRAPHWLQRIGFEWLFRVMQEPIRLGPRYMLTNPTALYHLLTKTHD